MPFPSQYSTYLKYVAQTSQTNISIYFKFFQFEASILKPFMRSGCSEDMQRASCGALLVAPESPEARVEAQ